MPRHRFSGWGVPRLHGNVVRQGCCVPSGVPRRRKAVLASAWDAVLFSGARSSVATRDRLLPRNVVRFPATCRPGRRGAQGAAHGWNEVEVVGDPPPPRNPLRDVLLFRALVLRRAAGSRDVACRSTYGVRSQRRGPGKPPCRPVPPEKSQARVCGSSGTSTPLRGSGIRGRGDSVPSRSFRPIDIQGGRRSGSARARRGLHGLLGLPAGCAGGSRRGGVQPPLVDLDGRFSASR